MAVLPGTVPIRQYLRDHGIPNEMIQWDQQRGLVQVGEHTIKPTQNISGTTYATPGVLQQVISAIQGTTTPKPTSSGGSRTSRSSGTVPIRQYLRDHGVPDELIQWDQERGLVRVGGYTIQPTHNISGTTYAPPEILQQVVSGIVGSRGSGGSRSTKTTSTSMSTQDYFQPIIDQIQQLALSAARQPDLTSVVREFNRLLGNLTPNYNVPTFEEAQAQIMKSLAPVMESAQRQLGQQYEQAQRRLMGAQAVAGIVGSDPAARQLHTLGNIHQQSLGE